MSAIGVEMATKIETLATTWRRRRMGRVPVRLAAVGLLLVAIGDHGAAVSSRGIDPLEILNLQIKPNVIVVLDSSGSMQETVGGTDTRSGDHPRSKMHQAKQVLKQVIAENQSKVSFLFGQYTQNVYNPDNTGGPEGPANAAKPVSTTGTRLSARGAITSTSENNFRFRYTTNNFLSPSMTTTELTVRRQPPPITAVVITASSNDVIQFMERTSGTGTNTPRRYYDCSITVAPGTYNIDDASMIALAAQITTQLQLASYSAGCTGYNNTGTTTASPPLNSYTLAWDTTNGRFNIRRTGGSNRWQFRFASAGSSAGPALGFVDNLPVGLSGPGVGSANVTSTTFTGSNWQDAETPVANRLTATSKGFQAWQDIRNTWNTLYFQEGSTNCVVTVPVGFYATGESLATAMKTAMESCTGRGATPNTYNVTFDISDGDFTFSRATGSASWTMQWSQATNSIRGPLNAGTSNAGSFTTGSHTTGVSITLLRRSSSSEIVENVDYDGDGTLDVLTTYHVVTGRLFNGETLLVIGDGTLCGLGTTAAATNPPNVRLQEVSSCGGSAVGSPVIFTWAGGSFGNNSIACGGFQVNVPLQSCENTSGQLALIQPNLENEIAVDASGVPLDYAELQDGSYGTTLTSRPGILSGLKADGLTPIANSLRDIRQGRTTAPLFIGFGTSNATGLWGAGQTTPAVTAINTHVDPKERTIVLFVTDGDDTCTGSGDDAAKAAAFRAEQLYTRIVSTEPASSVQTFVVGFGSGASVNRLNWIAWGGSGLGQGATGQPDITNDGTKWTDTNATIQTQRNLCTTCEDAFVAPDAATLAAVLRAIIEQGASLGEFTAQASITDNVMEYTGDISGTAPNGEAFDPDNQDTRYMGVVPVLFRSSFELPGFKGQLKAITNEAGTPTQRWNAGQVLQDLVVNGPANNSTGTASCGDDGTLNSGLCLFSSLTTKIQRKVYSTSRNGVFPVTIANYFDTTWLRSNGNRVNLWPPATAVDPAAGTVGTLDVALGIASMAFVDLQAEFGACEGGPLPIACGDTTLQTGQAIKEARQIILAYMAGAQASLDVAGDPQRTASGQILFRARNWVLSDSTLADPALVPAPIVSSPDNGGFGPEYALMRDGLRNANVGTNGLDVGFGLRQPDNDIDNPSSGPDGRALLKPVMTVLYAPANDMLHAFRAGRSNASTSIACTRSATLDCGGEELWGFVPFDQLGKLRERLRPQSRNDHTYMMGAAVRFADVFVPNAGTTGNYDGSTATRTADGATSAPLKGVWRRILLVGRGIGGKHLTALDITSPGPYTRDTKDTGSTSIIGPIVLWNRGNPDTDEGTSPGTPSHDATDTAGYALMGETWSTPTISRVDKLPTNRKSCAGSSIAEQACVDQSGGGVSFVSFVGSGYGDPGEGTTFFTLDVLTGDIVATADVGSRSPAPAGAYDNALVAPATVLSQAEFTTTNPPHPADTKATRIYIGDLHGRLWKFLATRPGLAIQFADLGVDQPVATPVSLMVINLKPFIFVSAGNESRANPNTSGQFKLYAFRDDQTDTDTTQPATLNSCTSTPVLPCLFSKTFEPLFRGTVQPATVFGRDASGQLAGRVFFVGTRFIPPPPESTLSTQVPPYPCKSRFDSILFGLGAETGLAAFDLNTSSSQDEFTILDNSRIVGAAVQADPSTGAMSLSLDEGLSGTGAPPNNPPQDGPRPQAPGSRGVTMSTLRMASTVCHQ